MHRRYNDSVLCWQNAFAATLVCVVVLANSGLRAQQVQQVKDRSVTYSSGQPIANRLLPDDDVVNVKRMFDSSVQIPEPDGKELVVNGTSASDVVALVHVVSVEAILVENGAWIHTRVTGTVQQVFKSQIDGAKLLGTALSAELNGGELKIGHVIVRAGNVVAFQPDGQYLLFVAGRPDIGYPNAALVPLQIEKGVVIGPAGSLPGDKLRGTKLDEVLRLIRRAPKK